MPRLIHKVKRSFQTVKDHVESTYNHPIDGIISTACIALIGLDIVILVLGTMATPGIVQVLTWISLMTLFGILVLNFNRT